MQRRETSFPLPSGQLAYGPDTLAAAADVGRDKIFQALASGELKGRKFGRRTLILAEDAAEWLRSLPVREASAA